MSVVGLVFVISGLGLWFKKQWARWGAIGISVVMALFIGSMDVAGGKAGIWTLLLIAVALYGAWRIWKDCRPLTVLDAAKDKEALVSLVLLLREPRYLEARILAEIVSSAWGGRFTSDDDGESGDASQRFVVGETPLFLIQAPEGLFIVHNRSEQYFEEMEGVLDYLDELRIHKAVKDHQAWLSVDLISIHSDAPKESVYPMTSKLIAELSGPDCTALFQPESGKIKVWSPALEEELRGRNCLEVFEKPSNVPVIHVPDDDPRMQAAVEKARTRWPEFVAAFQKREGECFSVKAPVTVNDNTDFLWVEVEGLEPEFIHGKLGNDPVDLGELAMGDRVEIPLKDLNDWTFIRNGEPVGLFTVKVISEIERGRS